MSLVIVHLSDLHINMGKNADIINAKSQSFYNACSSIIAKNDTVLLVITGDIADTGDAKEYYIAKKVINGFYEYIKSQHEKVNMCFFATPGNHDCDFSLGDIVRQRLMQTINKSSPCVEQEIVDIICRPQLNYEQFAEEMNTNIKNHLGHKYILKFENQSIGILLINSAWLSTKQEKYGELSIPIEMLPDSGAKDVDFTISLQHHPFQWLHPENSISLQKYFRSCIDLSIFGHEHIIDDETSSGNQWSFKKLKGHEFQNRSGGYEGGFAVYKLSSQLARISTFEYFWSEKDHAFDLVNETVNQELSKNKRDNRHFKLKKSSESFLNDLGLALQHPKKEILYLDDVFCWPTLEVHEMDQTKSNVKIRINNDVPDYLSKQKTVLIDGGTLHGKTSLAKMFFKYQYARENISIWFDWKLITKYEIDSIKKRFDKCFLEQYETNKVEPFRQLPKDKKTIIIDDFDCMDIGEEKRKVLFDAIQDYFGCTLLLTSSSMSFPYLWRELKDYSLVMMRILPLGNVKRSELIRKWYILDDASFEAQGVEVDVKVNRAREVIDRILGDGSGLLPASPFNILGTLQNIESVAAIGSQASKFGYIYESLIRKNFERIPENYRELLMELSTHLAYKLYQKKKLIIARSELEKLIDDFKTKFRITLDNNIALSSLCNARIFSFDKLNNYQFAYTYFYYYFVGKFFAQNIAKPEIKKQIEYISSRLYVEAYGNIMLFVCHFTNEESVIEELLLNAYCIYDDVDEFKFDQHKDVVERLNNLVENQLRIKPVGNEEDVKKQKHDELVRRDGLGINDGSERITDESCFEETSSEQKITQFLNAIKTISVLGQIVYNYPGKITGAKKEEIISETHSLGLRTIQMLMDTLGFFEEGLIESYVEYVRKNKKEVLEADIANKVSFMVMSSIALFTQGILFSIARLLGNDLLYEVDKEVLTKSGSISGKLILTEIEMNHINRVMFQDYIEYYKELKESKNTFAASILRYSVADFLSNNSCGHDLRDKLCAAFQLDKKAVLHIS